MPHALPDDPDCEGAQPVLFGAGEFVAIAVEPDRAEGSRPRQDQHAAPPRVVHPAVVGRAFGGFRGIVEPAELGGEQTAQIVDLDMRCAAQPGQCSFVVGVARVQDQRPVFHSEICFTDHVTGIPPHRGAAAGVTGTTSVQLIP